MEILDNFTCRFILYLLIPVLNKFMEKKILEYMELLIDFSETFYSIYWNFFCSFFAKFRKILEFQFRKSANTDAMKVQILFKIFMMM